MMNTLVRARELSFHAQRTRVLTRMRTLSTMYFLFGLALIGYWGFAALLHFLHLADMEEASTVHLPLRYTRTSTLISLLSSPFSFTLMAVPASLPLAVAAPLALCALLLPFTFFFVMLVLVELFWHVRQCISIDAEFSKPLHALASRRV